MKADAGAGATAAAAHSGSGLARCRCRRHRRPPAPAALSRLAARSTDPETPCVLMATARAWERREGRSGAQAAAGPRVLQNLAASVTRRHRRSEGGQEENVTRWDGRQGVEVSHLHSPTSMVPTVTSTALRCRQLPSQHPLLLWSSHSFESSDASIVTVLNCLVQCLQLGGGARGSLEAAAMLPPHPPGTSQGG